MDGKRILRSNLLQLIETAIAGEEIIERGLGYTSDSALLAGWRELQRAVENGETSIEITN